MNGENQDKNDKKSPGPLGREQLAEGMHASLDSASQGHQMGGNIKAGSGAN